MHSFCSRLPTPPSLVFLDGKPTASFVAVAPPIASMGTLHPSRQFPPTRRALFLPNLPLSTPIFIRPTVLINIFPIRRAGKEHSTPACPTNSPLTAQTQTCYKQNNARR